VAAVAVGGIVFLFVLPGRTFLAQGRARGAAQHQDTALSRENAALAQQVAQLQSTAYIEQLAREQYGLVRPGEQAYSVVPPTVLPPSTTTTTTTATTSSPKTLAPPRAR
jgi:hypothetical protein